MKRKEITTVLMAALASVMITACGGSPVNTVTDTRADQETQAPSAPIEDQEHTAESPEPALDFAASVVQTSEDNLLELASPETSAMTLFTYDGKTVRSSTIYDSKTEQRILDSLTAVKATNVEGWTPEDADFPIYGIEIGREDGWSILAAWSNGYWIAQDGSVYRFDFDFEHLASQEPWEDERELPSFTSFPCARMFTQENRAWNKRFLVPAAPLNPPEGITMTLDAWEENSAVVIISNDSDEDWSFGEFYEVQVLLDDIWYEIPTVPGNWGFNCLGYYLPAGQSQSMTHYMSMYGALPSGTYRIVLNGLSTEYQVP